MVMSRPGRWLDHRVGVQVADVGHAGRVESRTRCSTRSDAVQDAALPVLRDPERRVGVADVEEVAVDADDGVRVDHEATSWR